MLLSHAGESAANIASMATLCLRSAAPGVRYTPPKENVWGARKWSKKRRSGVSKIVSARGFSAGAWSAEGRLLAGGPTGGDGTGGGGKPYNRQEPNPGRGGRGS